MNLNDLPQGLPNYVGPDDPMITKKAPLRVVRLSTLDTDKGGLVQPEVFDGGEALPESEGVDIGHPISPEEREALEREGHLGPEGEYFGGPHDEPWAVGIVDKGFTNESDTVVYPPEGWSRHRCVLECGFYLDVPPTELGVLGTPSTTSMRYQAEAEERMLVHYESEHGVQELVRALHEARQPQHRPAPTGVQAGFEGTTPGPARRSPEVQAAVDQMTSGRLAAARRPRTAEEKAAYDAAVTAEFERKRQEAQMDPYKLTPRYTADLDQGVVGIKR